MRLGILIPGVLLLPVGVLFFYPFGTTFLVLGLILILLGALLPGRGQAPRQDALLQSVVARLWQLEARQAVLEEHVRRLGARIDGLPPEAAALPPPYTGAPSPPSPPPWAVPAAAVPPGPVPMPPAPVAPAPGQPPAAPPAAPGAISRIEQELGEKWFQRIGILVLGIAFVFLLVIVLPRLTPQQIVSLDFVVAIGLGLLGEYIFARKGLREYAKGLEAGAFGIAYIGVWGGGFFFRLPGFPWDVLLGATLVAHAAAALRYRSPFLSVEVGLFYLGWLTWLRAIAVLEAPEYAILLSAGSVGVLALAYAQRSEVTGVVLMFAFDAVALGAFSLLAPYGYVPVLVVGVVTAAFVALVRLERLFPAPASHRLATWVSGLVLTYGVLIANSLPIARRGGIDDVTIASTFVTLTAAFTVSEVLLRDRAHPLAFAGVLGGLAFPVPLLMARGELALVVFPAVLLALVLLRPTKGLAWLANVAYLGLIAFAAVAAADPLAQFGAIWVIFLGVVALHAFLQTRSGYGPAPADLPTDLQVPLYIVALAGLTTRALPGPAALTLYAIGLPLAVLLNRHALRGPPWKAALAIATLGGAMGLARWWAFGNLLAGPPSSDGPLLAAYHVTVLVALGAWIVYRKSVETMTAPGLGTVRISWPALALLTGLVAQDWYETHVLAILPIVVAGFAYVLDDAVTFHIAYFLIPVEVIAAAARLLERPGDAVLLAPAFVGVLIASGFAHDLAGFRQALARVSEVSGSAAWLIAAPLAFGLDVQTTVAWAVAGGAAVAWGLWRKYATVRYIGFVLLFLVLGKVFLYDISGLEVAVRILALIVVAIALLGISYGYARLRKRQAAPI